MSTPNTSSTRPDPQETLKYFLDRLDNGEDPTEVVREAYNRGIDDVVAMIEARSEAEGRELLYDFDPNNPGQMQKLFIAVLVFVIAGLALAHVFNFLLVSR